MFAGSDIQERRRKRCNWPGHITLDQLGLDTLCQCMQQSSSSNQVESWGVLTKPDIPRLKLQSFTLQDVDNPACFTQTD